jgi:hypothetical protein
VWKLSCPEPVYVFFVLPRPVTGPNVKCAYLSNNDVVWLDLQSRAASCMLSPLMGYLLSKSSEFEHTINVTFEKQGSRCFALCRANTELPSVSGGTTVCSHRTLLGSRISSIPFAEYTWLVTR